MRRSCPALRFCGGWSQSDWPAEDFTLLQNLSDLQHHEREHIDRKAFTFTVLNPPGTQCLGCVYIVPVRLEEISLCKDTAYPADVGFWIRTSELVNDLDQQLLSTIRDWFRTEWAFDCILFTINPQNSRQAALLIEAGLEKRLTCTSMDGCIWWVFG